MDVLDIGCGASKEPGAIGMDRLPLPNVDVLHDMDVFPYPFGDNSFDRVVMNNSIEHVDDPIRVLQELHRVARHGAIIHIETPHYSSCDYYTDPTHKHPFSSRTFDYIVAGTKLSEFRYADNVRFNKVDVRLTFLTGLSLLDRMAERLVNRWQHPYELRLAWMFPARQVIADIRVIK
jgi:SAM-dependent methyltransferase